MLVVALKLGQVFANDNSSHREAHAEQFLSGMKRLNVLDRLGEVGVGVCAVGLGAGNRDVRSSVVDHVNGHFICESSLRSVLDINFLTGSRQAGDDHDHAPALRMWDAFEA